MENSNSKTVSRTALAWAGILTMIAGIVMTIIGSVPDAPFQIEFETFKMTTPKTGLVIAGLGALLGYFATKNDPNGGPVVFSGETTKDQKFKRNVKKASIVIGILAVVFLIAFYAFNF